MRKTLHSRKRKNQECIDRRWHKIRPVSLHTKRHLLGRTSCVIMNSLKIFNALLYIK